jgi:hypothetical protein
MRILLEGTMLTVERLKELLSYDPQTGVFVWLVSPANNTSAGAIAGSKGRSATPRHRDGYVKITMFGRPYKAHRLAWLYMTGEWPSAMIDHKDGDGLNNKWSNLRLATQSQNNANSVLYRNNSSGRRGVYWCNREKKWIAQITVDYRRKHLGYFDDIEVADAAYRDAAQTFYGEYARRCHAPQ